MLEIVSINQKGKRPGHFLRPISHLRIGLVVIRDYTRYPNKIVMIG